MNTTINTCIFDYGDTLVGYPLCNVPGQLAFIRHFFGFNAARHPRMPASPLVPPSELDAFAKRLNTERATGEVWPFHERIFSRDFLGGQLDQDQAIELERAMCSELFRLGQTFPDSLPTLRELRKRGYRLGIVSNTPWGTSPRLWRQELEQRGFGEGLIDVTIFCCDVGYRKPRPEPIQECLARLGSAPEATLFVGDNPTADMMGARSAGCERALLCPTGMAQAADAEVRVISALSELLKLLD